MIRVSQSQAASLFENQSQAHAGGPAKPRVRRPKAELPENIIEESICSFLRANGWYLKRNQVGLYVPFRVLRDPKAMASPHPIRIGETGEADWMAYRPGSSNFSFTLFFWEAKAPGKKPNPDQIRWLFNRRALGFLADFFDDFNDFPGKDHSFLEWYRRHFS